MTTLNARLIRITLPTLFAVAALVGIAATADHLVNPQSVVVKSDPVVDAELLVIDHRSEEKTDDPILDKDNFLDKDNLLDKADLLGIESL